MHALLQQQLHQAPLESLWIADENSKALLQGGLRFCGDLLTNRWDIARLAAGRCARVYFSDFAFDELKQRYQQIIYPVSKEKAAVHYIINRTADILLEGGALKLLGEKQSGIKTYAAKAAQRLANTKHLEKHGGDYLSITELQHGAAIRPSLDDSDYASLRQLESIGNLYSKPGLFGWNKIDTGSALLAAQLPDHLPAAAAQVVDLGCGYGYLSAQLAGLGKYRITATDNNAAALLACAENFRTLGIDGRVIPADAGDELEADCADYLICNPPFHQGFQVEGDLTEHFLQQSARLLKPGGRALFVVNEFIPLRKKAAAHFNNVQLLAKDKGFCVYLLEH